MDDLKLWLWLEFELSEDYRDLIIRFGLVIEIKRRNYWLESTKFESRSENYCDWTYYKSFASMIEGLADEQHFSPLLKFYYPKSLADLIYYTSHKKKSKR